jgi:tRNA-specific 2-thiouridylase
MYYTIGQRQGLGIGGVKGASEDPWYVLNKDLSNNILIVGQGHNHPLLFHNSLTASQFDWVSDQPPTGTKTCAAKIRYRQEDQPCQIEPLPDHRYRVTFESAQRAITPGQSVVFYDQDICLGGGIIDYAENR